ncbi:hypothetical protein Bbelb_218940 [Branchiostoma belcheri]|nr:hypothetical protein Bbelb_218940 [Branchiostoma belcheri]
METENVAYRSASFLRENRPGDVAETPRRANDDLEEEYTCGFAKRCRMMFCPPHFRGVTIAVAAAVYIDKMKGSPIVSSTTSTTSALLLKTSISPPTTVPEVTTLLSDVTPTPPGMTPTQPDPLPLSTEEMIFNRAQKTEGQTSSTKTTKKCFTKWRGTCYKAFGTPKKFWAANEHCRRYGGTLAMPKDAATNRRLISLMRRFIHQVFFFGLHDEGKEGSFKWIDGTKLGSFSSWGRGEPNNSRGREDCVVYLRVYRKWNDFSCNIAHYFLCQVAPGRT